PINWTHPPTPTTTLPTYPFHHHRYWPRPPHHHTTNPTGLGLDPTTHPLLSGTVDLPDNDGLLLTGRLSIESHPWLAEHAVAGTVLLPGAAFVDLALHAGQQVDCDHIDDLTIEQPLTLTPDGQVQLQVRLDGPDASGRRSLSIHSRTHLDNDRQPWLRHAVGALSRSPVPAVTVDGEWPPARAEAVDIEGLYPRLADKGLEYLGVFRGVQAVWRRGAELFAEVSLPAQHSAAARFAVHPALLDAALHPLAAADDGVRLPFAWNGVTLRATGATSVRVHLAPGEHDEVRITVTDPANAAVLTVDALSARPVDPQRLSAERERVESLFALDWVPVSGSADAVSTGPWTVLGGHGGEGLADALSAAGVPMSTDRAAARTHVLPYVAGAVDGPVPAVTRGRLTTLLSDVQQWLADPAHDDSRLVVVTRRAVAAQPGEAITDLAGAAGWGLLRSAQNEHPDRIVLIDLDAVAVSGAALPAAVASGEPQLAVRDGASHAPRLAEVDALPTLVPPAAAWRLAATGNGSLGMVLAPVDDADEPLGAGEVRVAVRAVGLNFRDVLLALGTLPDDPRPIAAEGAGVVLEVGPGVDALRPGDRVMGLLSGGAGPVSTAQQEMLTTIPDGWSFAEAASMPVVFLTAYRGLVEIAKMQPGESLLLHAAAGGVGLVTVQLARHLGVEVFGTASPSKWDALRECGFDDAHLASSRTLDFEGHFRVAGVDVVLNSLVGEFIDSSLRLLRPGGRFVEIGKSDYRDPDKVGADHPGVTYRAFDVLDTDPAYIQQLLRQLRAWGEEGVLRPLPVTAWDIRRAPQALRYLARGKNIGKVVLTLPRDLDPAGTVLVTGATGTLGGLLARHLVTRHGVRHLLLTGRRGADAEGVGDLLADLSLLGAKAQVVACDTADRAALAEVLTRIPAAHPLTAVVHAAGVLADGTFDALDPQRLETVLRPKVDGAWHLHELTLDADLAAFVLYSSAAGTFGTPGQANYAAGNAFLDALARHRHRSGLPATSLGWGLWTATSALTRDLDEADLGRLARTGSLPLSTPEGLALFDSALGLDHAALLPVKLDLPALRERAGEQTVPALLKGLAGPVRRRVAAVPAATVDTQSWTARLAALDHADRRDALLTLIRSEAAAVLGHSGPDAIGAENPFGDLGFDSLTAVELRNRLNVRTGRRLPATLLFRYPTPTALTAYLAAEVFGDAQG
ncbi:SDR family NAD(P)-dependent oxidoreductase, partial [Micromonospora sp. DT31]|uniref:SDR family NAD(P)-dependent oxidoreductase n=1 Tax=Micromonospora sp. DT31 TaxID=3393434 RepID=UPI003CE701DA